MRVLLAFFQSLKLAKFTAAYLQFHPVKKKQTKKDKTCNHKKCVVRFEAGDWEVYFELQAEEDIVNKDNGVRMQII